jgi:hypothetical protein
MYSLQRLSPNMWAVSSTWRPFALLFRSFLVSYSTICHNYS